MATWYTYWLDQIVQKKKKFLDSFALANNSILENYTSLKRNSLFPDVEVPAYERYVGMPEELYIELLTRVLLK